MSRNKTGGKKLRLASYLKKRPAPRWADIKKFTLAGARSRRIRITVPKWKRGKNLNV